MCAILMGMLTEVFGLFRECGSKLGRQERLSWYQLEGFLAGMGKAAEELQIRDPDLIHIGGVSIFYRGLDTFGPSAVPNFRGTVDLDVLSFGPGSFDYLMDHMKDKGQIESSKKRTSMGFPDKFTYEVAMPKDNNVGAIHEVKVDLYSASGRVKFNDRFMTPDAIVLDPPERLHGLSRQKGMVVVPSLRDSFIIKMDIVASSHSGLRDKDQGDILWMLGMIAKRKERFDDYLGVMMADEGWRTGYKGAGAKLGELKSLFEGAIGDTTNPVSRKIAEDALRAVRDRMKRS